MKIPVQYKKYLYAQSVPLYTSGGNPNTTELTSYGTTVTI